MSTPDFGTNQSFQTIPAPLRKRIFGTIKQWIKILFYFISRQNWGVQLERSVICFIYLRSLFYMGLINTLKTVLIYNLVNFSYK